MFSLTKEYRQKRTFLNILRYHATFMDTNYYAIAKEGYKLNPYVFAALRLISSNVAGIEWIMYQRQGKDLIEIENHPCVNLLYRPNPFQSKSLFFETLISYWYLGGETFLRRLGPDNKPPLEIYPLRPDRMDIFFGTPIDPIAYYQYNTDQKIEKFEPEEVLHLKFFDPLDDWRGMSPFKPGARSVDQNNASREWNVSLLQNGAKLGGALVTEEELSEDAYNRLKEQIDTEYSGPQNAGKPKLFEGGVKWQSMSLSPVDMDWIAGQKLSAREVAIVTGVPPELLGDIDNRAYNSYKEARKALYEECILPLMDNLRDSLNEWLVPLYGDNLCLGYDKDSIEALQDERDSVWKRATEGFTKRIITLNEARELLGYTAVDNGDDFYDPLSFMSAGETESEIEEEQKSLLGPTGKKKVLQQGKGNKYLEY